MSRPLRIEYAGAFYHVMNRGAGRKVIFEDPLEDRGLFLGVLGEAAHLWNIRIHAYSLMDNHYHLLIETPLPNLSRAMRHIDGVYTQRFNRRARRDGALFRGRYKSILVQKESYFLELVRYIHLNGVKAVKYPHPGLDPNCSHGEYMATRSRPQWLRTELALSFFEPGQSGVLTRFDAYVRAGVSEELETILAHKRWPAILGLKSFVIDIRDRFGLAKPAHHEKPQERDLISESRFQPQQMIAEVADVFGISVSGILGRGCKRHACARQVAMYLLRHSCHQSYEQIGTILGAITGSAVAYGLNRLKKR
jgi:REP element-mobilizing transposase RayT